MADDLQTLNPDDALAKRAQEGEILNPKSAGDALIEELSKGKGKKYVRFIMAALGSVPWIGSHLGYWVQ